MVKKFTGQISTFNETKLIPALDYEAEYDHLDSYSAIPAAELPSEKDVLKSVNDARKANARSKAIAARCSLAGLEKPTAKDDGEAIRQMAKIFVARGKTQAEAEAIARENLGL